MSTRIRNREHRTTLRGRAFPRACGGAALLAALPWTAGACGPTEVLVGDAPGIARVVAGVLGVAAEVPVAASLDTAVIGDALEVPIGPPAGLAAFEDGSFYFADRRRRRIGHVTAEGRLTWPVGRGTCSVPGLGDGTPEGVCFITPAGLALDDQDRLVISDDRANVVYRYDPAAEQVERVLGRGPEGQADSGAVARDALTFGPADVAIGPDGAVQVAERRNHRVVRVGSDGILTIAAGTGVQGDAGDGGPAAAAQLSLPEGVHWMGDTLYIADSGNHRLRRVIDGVIESYAGIGAAGFLGDGGPASLALFNRPGRMASAGALLFVTDRGNQRVRVIRVGPDSIRTFGGTGAREPGQDLLEIGRTSLATPAGLAAAGRAVFVADSGGFVVRRVVR